MREKTLERLLRVQELAGRLDVLEDFKRCLENGQARIVFGERLTPPRDSDYESDLVYDESAVEVPLSEQEPEDETHHLIGSRINDFKQRLIAGINGDIIATEAEIEAICGEKCKKGREASDG